MKFVYTSNSAGDTVIPVDKVRAHLNPTAGHCLPLDEPDWLSVEISDWISSTKFIANSH